MNLVRVENRTKVVRVSHAEEVRQFLIFLLKGEPKGRPNGFSHYLLELGEAFLEGHVSSYVTSQHFKLFLEGRSIFFTS